MSRLTASPFNKPSPFEFPRLPLSPPETNHGSAGPSLANLVENGSEAHHTDSLVAEPPGSRSRRRPSIIYQNTGIRESRDRQVQRSYKSFIIVIPPATLIQEHGQLGHTLTTGPPHRLPQGLIMPLYPTVYGQLTAIAREFNFPSTAGLCLYLHFTDNGITMTPRISDDLWHYLWNHAFESASSPTRGPPIAGKVEFDLDYRQARWYTSWISSTHREHVDVPISALPSTAPSTIHFRAESRTTFAEDRLPDEDLPNDVHSFNHRYTNTVSRHVPRKLSLVDKYDATPTRTGSRPASYSPPDLALTAFQGLSPIYQEEEPKSARHDLDHRVNSWRAVAELKPVSLAGTGQVSLIPANLPNNLPIDDNSIPFERNELDLADFAWSISSAGPGDYDDMSSVSSVGRLPSPDLAHRMYEDVPPTPSTHTSWGPPSCYPPSPYIFPRVISPDLGQRNCFSRPTTPSTATSWGPSWTSISESSCSEYDFYSIHMADRGEFSRPVTPSTTTSWGPNLTYPPTPASPYRVPTPDIAHLFLEDSAEHLSKCGHQPWAHIWPYHRDEQRPWVFVWPYHFNVLGKISLDSITDRSVLRATGSTQVLNAKVYNASCNYGSHYPYFNLYPAVYPHFDIYPRKSLEALDCDSNSLRRFNTNINPMEKLDVFLTDAPLIYEYPYINIYRSVYPWNLQEIYISKVSINPNLAKKLDMVSPMDAPLIYEYPYINIYRSVYPWNLQEIYISKVLYKCASGSGSSTDHLPDEYPESVTLHTFSNRFTKAWRQALYFQYPNFNLYPQSDTGSYQEKTTLNILPERISLTRCTRYPVFALYPPVYPFFDIYPSIEGPPLDMDHYSDTTRSQSLFPHPSFNLYPVVYPYFDIYPAITTADGHTSARSTGYPSFNLYPDINAVNDDYSKHYESSYQINKPNLDVFPLVSSTELNHNFLSLSVIHYPYINLYPAVYPYFELWPTIPGGENPLSSETSYDYASQVAAAEQNNIRKQSRKRKSHFDLHKSIFPLDIVKTPSGTRTENSISAVAQDSRRYSMQNSRLKINSVRPLSGNTGLRTPSTPVSPNSGRRLPIPPSSGSSFSSAYELMSTLIAEGSSSPIRTSPMRKSVIAPHLPAMRAGSPHAYSRLTFDVGSDSVAPFGNPTTQMLISHEEKPIRSLSASVVSRHATRKRDSLLLQRARSSEGDISFTADDLLDFPLPPASPVPPVPRAPKTYGSSKPFFTST